VRCRVIDPAAQIQIKEMTPVWVPGRAIREKDLDDIRRLRATLKTAETETAMAPQASRPYMPGYGIAAANEGSGLLPWSWAEQRLTASHDYWLATVQSDGRPHVMPVGGVWDGESLWFSSSLGSQKARNLTRDPRATITTDDPNEPVVVDGIVTRVEAEAANRQFAALVNAKYETDYPVEFFTANASFRLRPVWAFGLMQSDFSGSPTRWTFG
jgi:PPOX class probable F420-dependent enzyme